MGNNKQVGKVKKKGRPSLLDLQKRSLRLQKQEQQRSKSPKPSPNPYLKFPNSTSTRRSTTPLDADEEEDDEEEVPNGGKKKKKEKKLKLVLNIPPNVSSDLASSGSDLDVNGEGYRKKRKIDSLQIEHDYVNCAVNSFKMDRTGRQSSSWKATDPPPVQGTEDPSGPGPMTTLPDIKLLTFILDRLQKKDTYGVFLEPVDPDELPDYHDIIEHPMDFTTVRNKLSNGAYACLEQFESDVFLISSNAMRYNAPDTIYYRQARSIQELARKDFENIRQESDDNETEPHIVRRGRPPIKNKIKRMLAKAPADRTGCVSSSNATLANSRNDTHSNSTNDLMRKGSSFDKTSIVDSSTRTSHAPRYNETPKSNGDPRSEYLGSSHKGIQMRNWKKQLVIDENRRDTYKQPILSTIGQEPSVLTVFDLERKQLAPVGFQMEHSYARSLARFAANLGPLGWEIAAKKIQRALPPGIKFGRGWVGDNEAPPPQPSLLPAYPHISTQMKILHCSTLSGGDKLMEGHEPLSIDSALPPSASASAVQTLSRSTDSVDGVEACRTVNPEGKLDLAENGMGPKSPFHLCKDSAVQPCMNGSNPGPGVSQTWKSVSHTRPPEELMPHARVINMVCRNGDNSFGNHQAPLRQVDAEEKTGLAKGNPSTIHSGNTLRHADHHSGGQWGALSMNPKPGSCPPDLNVDFQSPVSGILADPEEQQQQKQPDLALQL